MFVRALQVLLCGEFHDGYIVEKNEIYTEEIRAKCAVLERFLSFIDVTVVGIARTSRDVELMELKKTHGKVIETLDLRPVETPHVRAIVELDVMTVEIAHGRCWWK